MIPKLSKEDQKLRDALTERYYQDHSNERPYKLSMGKKILAFICALVLTDFISYKGGD